MIEVYRVVGDSECFGISRSDLDVIIPYSDSLETMSIITYCHKKKIQNHG